MFIRDDERNGLLQLDTDCRNIQLAMSLNGILAERCECNHPLEIYRAFGVEAARQSIIIEIRKVYRFYGINVGATHITTIADAMTVAGGLMSIDRHGINHGEFNTLAKAAFEEFADVLTKAAVRDTSDDLQDNTSRIMLGKEVRVGTGTFDLFLDRDCHEHMAKTYQQSHRERKRKERRERAIHERIEHTFPTNNTATATTTYEPYQPPPQLDSMSILGGANDDDDFDPFALEQNEDEFGYALYSPTQPIYR